MIAHPVIKYYATHFTLSEEVTVATTAMFKKKEKAMKEDVFMTTLVIVCDVCNGWGHIATDKQLSAKSTTREY